MTEVFEAGLDGIIVFDHQGTVLQFSPAAERQFGYPRSEAVGRNLADLVIPARLRQTDGMGLERSLAGASDLAPTRLELTAMRRDGTEVPVELTLGRRRSTPPTFVAFVRDISEGRRAEERRTRVEQEAERHRRVVAELARLGSVVARSLNPIEVAREIVRSARELLNVPVAEVYELSAGSRDLRVLACDADPRHGFDPYPVLPAGCGAAGAAVEDLRSLVTPDVLGDPRIRLPAEVRASFERTPFLAALAVPLVAQEHALGALVVRDETGRTFDVGAVAMVTAFAHHGGDRAREGTALRGGRGPAARGRALSRSGDPDHRHARSRWDSRARDGGREGPVLGRHGAHRAPRRAIGRHGVSVHGRDPGRA